MRAWHARFERALWDEQHTRMVHLAPPSEARAVRKDASGSFTVENPPVTTADEFAGGYFIVEVDSMDEPLEWATRGRWMVGSNEVREIIEPNW